MTLPTTLPSDTPTPLRGGPTLRWGILGPGTISHAFVTAIHAFTDQHAVAVGSRSLDRARAFADELGVDRAYGSYEQLVEDPNVDIVYIGSPHSEHREHALLAIAAGKHVLVEKPIGVSARDARDIAAAARAAGVFAMEAMWSRFLPKSIVMARLLADGALGELDFVIADFGFNANYDPQARHWNPDLGGGALLDLGVYPVWFAQFALGAPSAVHAHGTLAPTGVDDRVSVGLEHPSGAHAQLAVSLRSDTGGHATISGRDARIVVEPLWVGPGNFRLIGGGVELEFVDPSGFQWRDGLCWQATAVAQHIADGRTEAPEHPLDTTISQLETIDAARRFVGYPPAE